MNDSRKEYIVQCIISVLNIPRSEFRSNTASNSNLEKFLDDQNEKVLQAVETDSSDKDKGKRTVTISPGFSNYKEGSNEMHFIKTSYEPLTEENIASLVQTSSIRQSPVRSLFFTMREVYMPLLIGADSQAQALEGRLADCLVELDAGLHATLRRGLAPNHKFDETDLSGIISPIDEVRFWSDYKSAPGISDAELDRATKFTEALSPIANEVEDLTKKSLSQLIDIMDQLTDVLETIWNNQDVAQPYNADRMKHFLKVLAGAIGRSVQAKLNGLKVWTSSFSNVSKHLREGHKVCEKWNDILADLTGIQWKNSEHRWEGEAYRDSFLTNLASRIQAVSDLRSQHDQILKLLTAEDLQVLQVDNCFEGFLNLAAFSYNDFTVPMWEGALRDYESRMQPIEAKIAERLRSELFSDKSNPAQTVRVFQRYQNLLERKNIRQALTNERERLLAELGDFIDRISHELETFDAESLPGGRGLSVHARRMMWLESLRAKADTAARPLTGFLKDLPATSKLVSQCKTVRQELKDSRTRAFKEWQEEIEGNLDDPDNPIALEMSSRVMDFDTTQQGALKITYSERLITLVKEARIFEQMGCPISRKIKQAVDNGLKYYRFAVQLKQICNFHNHMTSEILPCQKLMVLQPALAFEQLFSDKTSGMKKIQWAKLDQLETFTRNVKDGAERLRSVNRRLRNGHLQVASEVVQLANISLLRQRDMWKQKLAAFAKLIDTVTTSCGCQAEDAKPWRAHWDHQIFKIMEVQYRFGLESLNENLPEMKADIVLSNKQLKLKPPIEELKTMYFKEIKAFISLPLSFKGLEGASHIYKVMPERNQQAIATVFQKAEDLFSRVLSTQNSFMPWIVVGLLSERKDELIEAMEDVKEWELNFKALKLKRKEMEKIPDTMRIDCFTISTVVLKSIIEEHLERLSDQLTLALKRKIQDEVKEVLAFLTEALEKLNVGGLDSVSELGKAQAESKQLMLKQVEQQRKMSSAEEKNKMLRTVSLGVDMSEVHQKWEEFVLRLEAFETLAGELREQLRNKMDHRITTLNQDIEKFKSRWHSLKPKTATVCTLEEAKANSAKMEEWTNEWNTLKETIGTLHADCEDFGLQPPALENNQEIEDDLNRQQQSWTLFEEFTTALDEMQQQTWLDFRPRLFTLNDLSCEWIQKLKEVPRDPVIHMLSEKNQAINQGYTALRAMTGEAFEGEHWKILFGILKLPKDMTARTLTVGDIMAKIELVVEKVDELKELTARAVGEVTIREAVMELQAWSEQTEFEFLQHQTADGSTVPLIREWKELISAVSDNQALCSSLKDSRYFAPFKDQVDKFEEKLGLLDQLLISMNKVQRKWVYLEPIFGRGAMPHEKDRFEKVNREYRMIMKNLGHAKKVTFLCTQKGLKEQFINLADQLERCQRALNNFLEEKRAAFPRLYFIGDEDLLEILGQSSNAEVIQTHLKKLFAGINKVGFSEDKTEILQMKSSLGEVVDLLKSVRVKEGKEPLNVEIWLAQLSDEMKMTMAQGLSVCYSNAHELDLMNHSSQLLCLSANIHFTQNVEKLLGGGQNEGQLVQLKADLHKQLQELTSVPMENALQQAKLKALILDLIHNIAVCDELLGSKTQRKEEWSWFKQLRYYFSMNQASGNPCMVKMLEATMAYSFEYQGNAPKLVHTPLTDKAYLTMMHGMHLGYGGNPYGPAGTGKTESVKALGSCLGRQVLVFNCDEGIDFLAMGRIFVGLVRCGAWGCFDEFNRLLEEQMSAISQQIQVIQAAIKDRLPSLNYNAGSFVKEKIGREVAVDHNAGIFITLNPAMKGYGGRQKLPDNLKQLFRPVAMSVPDNELIAEVMMFSEGYVHAKVIAQKVVALFLLGRQLLSPQQHYDWGLRALKTILNLAGRLLQETKRDRAAEGNTVELSEVEESVILLKAVRMNTMSKLTFADCKRFQDLCMDLFPGVNVKDIEYKELEGFIIEACKDMKLNVIESQIAKILQFHEACNQRMGVGIVGPSGCGKSTMWKVLEQAYKKQGRKIIVHVMNPKSMSRVHLLGHMDHDTREWFDGVLTASARAVIKEPAETHNWVICDGDIDPEWVESLNSVLDDNRLLTMPNGERIQFGNNVNFVFETDSLRFASPATISRMGMIFLSEEDVDVKPLILSWIRQQPEDNQPNLEKWFDQIFYQALAWVYENKSGSPLQLSVETTRMGMVRNVLGHMIQKKDLETGAIIPVSKEDFLLAICRGFGGNLSYEVRKELTREVFKWGGDNLPDPRKPLNCFVGSGGKLTCYDPSSVESDINMQSLTQSHILPPLVPTVSVLRDMDLFRTWLADEQPFIVAGPEGCGKSLLIHHAINRFRNESDVSLNVAVLHCNAQTTSTHVLQKLRQFCTVTNGNQGRIYRPRDCRRVVLYIKDINLPKPDKYDTSQIIAFMQQVVMHKGFYDDDLEFVHIEHIQIVASMAPASTLGRHRLATRFTANVRVCSISYPSVDELAEIYNQMMGAALTNPNWANGIGPSGPQLAGKFAEGMVDLYSNMRSKFTQDDHEHYLFSPRDLTQWVLQLLRYEVQSVDDLCQAWAYEANRIFRDRLVGVKAQDLFDSLLKSAMVQFLNTDIDVDKLCFTSLLDIGDAGVPTGMLKPIALDDYRVMVEAGMKSYVREVKDLPIELFDEVLDHLAWIDRALAAPNNNDMLLVGRAGVGRRSICSLMSHMQRLSVFSPSPSRRYDDKEWKRDLKQVMQMTGVDKQHTVLFLEDHHLMKPEFLEIINSLLSAGEVPGLWTPEELEPLLAPLKEEFAQEQGRGGKGAARTPFEFFVRQVREHLRIVLSMDPTHSQFLPYCAANPALFTCCTVVWLDEWSQKSQHFVIQKQLADLTADKKSNLTMFLTQIHESMVSYAATPRHFMTLLQTSDAVFKKRLTSSSGQTSHLQKGLTKLQEVSQTVEKLSSDAVEKQKELEEKQRLAKEALGRIKEAMTRAAERKQEVEMLEKETEKDQEANTVEKQKIEKELAEIQPILDSAKKAVGSIKPDHLNEIRSLKMPPEPIHDVLNGVLRLMGNYDSSWASMKKFLAGSGAIQRIINFDPHQITPEVRNDVEKLLKEKANSFEHSVIYRVSVAAAPLAKWVHASVRYSAVLVKIAPMEKKLAAASEQLQEARARLVECRTQLEEIDQEVAALNEEFQNRTGEAEVLKMDLKKAEVTLAKASGLMEKLSGEKHRWEDQVREIERERELLPTNTCLAAAYITYLGHFPEDIRQKCSNKWMEFKNSPEPFDLLRIMSSESELLTWKSEGLPGDRLSQENGIMIKNGGMEPFIVDPNSQAIEWLKAHIPNAEVALQQDQKLMQQLELSVRFGKVLIISEVDGIETVYFPLLRKDFSRQGPRMVVQLGDKTCDFNEGFKMYMCTRNSNAIESLPPNASCLVTRVNFSVTRAGLEGQLLGATLQHEKPELEQRKSELLQREEEFKVQLADLEKQLLEQLADSSGNILENEPLIKSLEGTKAAASTIADSLAESSRLQMDLDQQREVYRPLATLGSRIFILLKDLSHLDRMYRFSLESFMKLFDKVLSLQITAETTEEMLRQLGNQLKIMVLFYTARSLFKKDRLTLGIHMVRGIAPESFKENEWELFQGTYLATSEPSSSAPSWCPPDRVSALQQLRGAFPRIDEAWQLSKEALWAPWVASDKCEETFDGSIYSRMTSFQRVLLIQAVRPDRLESALTMFACEMIGVSSLSPPALSLVRLHSDETVSTEPILFVTTPGADPSLELEEFAKSHSQQSAQSFNFHQLAMGGGQNDEAIKLINESARVGDWVCLKNLHLVISWLPLLEKELKNLKPHDNFRCWLTTEPHARFPAILLESSLKITYEAPPGVKKNLLRTFESWSPNWFGQGAEIRSQVIFVCAHFHAIMQERRTYIPQGWTKFYEFSQGDLSSACETVSLLVAAGEQMQKGGGPLDWTTLVGVLEFAVYGSRVDNEFDLRLVKEYLQIFFRNDVLEGGAGRKAGGSLQIPPFDIPKSRNMSEFRSRIEQLPDIDNPQSFGMAANADRTLQRINSTRVITMLRHLSTARDEQMVGSGGAIDIRACSDQLAPLWKSWDSVCRSQFAKVKSINVRAVRPEDPPLVAFILMDAAEACRIVDTVTNSLVALQKVVAGTGLSTPDLQAEALCLVKGEVPEGWEEGWSAAPEEPAAFLRGLSQKLVALKSDWLSRVEQGSVIDKPVNLSDFLRPDVFLNAMRQQTARALKVSVDSLHLVSSFQSNLLDRSNPECPMPVQLQDILLEGCAFDERAGVLTESTRSSPLLSVLPLLSICWMPRARHPERAVSSARNAVTVAIPIYVSLNRERFLADVVLHTESGQGARQRILNSAALFLTDTQ